MIKLEISAFESHSAQVFVISQARSTIGRNPTNDIVVGSENVSGTHAEIVRTDDGGLTIRDLGSINGTFVNGEPVTDSPIEPGDQLRFGNIEGNLTESSEAEPIAFGSLAISQAKKAMEKLKQELPDGPDQEPEPEIGAPSEEVAAKTETPSPDAASPEEPPETRLDELEPKKSARGDSDIADDALAASAAEIESLRARIAEFEKESTDGAPKDASDELAASAAEIESLRARIAELEKESADGAPEEDAGDELAAGAAEIESLRTRISEFEKDQSDLALANHTLTETLAEKTGAITELNGQLREKDAALADRRREKARLDAERGQSEQEAAEKAEQAASETAALRAEMAALKEAHGGVAEACAELGAVQQEIEFHGAQRTRRQQELNDFLAEAEATRQAVDEENAEMRRVLKTTRKEFDSLNQAINEAEQKEDLRREQVTAGIRELEERTQAEADALAGLEAQKAAAEAQLEDAAVSTREMEAKRDRLDAEVAKSEKAFKRIQRKIGRRKKLLERLKTVARREREVARKMEEGKRFLEAAEAQEAARDLPKIQPWDVDQARADRDEAMAEARMIQQEVDRLKAERKNRKRELEGIEAGASEEESLDPPPSEKHHDPNRESGDPSRLTAPLPSGRQDLAAEIP